MEAQESSLKLGELDLFVDSMEPTSIDSIGNQRWLDWNKRLRKLNKQATLESSSMQEELIKKTILNSGKLPVLVSEAICIQVWRTKIYPQIVELESAPELTSGVYTVLLHESAAVGLLETVLSDQVDVKCICEVVIDLSNYVVEQLTALLDLINNGYLKPVTAKELERETAIEKLNRQTRDVQFDISIKCISIVHYIVDHMEMEGACASIFTNLYKTHDVPSLLTHLLLHEPWMKRNDEGELQIFNSGRWSKPSAEDLSQMHRTEAQLWLCVRQLLLEPRLTHYYTIDECRRNTFCRLLSNPMLDLIPPLADLKMFLCRHAAGGYCSLNGFEDPACMLACSRVIVPQIKEAYLKQIHKRSEILAKVQLEAFHSEGSKKSRTMADRLSKCPSDAALALDSGGAKCAKCGDKATKKCSKCKTEWYCSRECQVQQWPKHKDKCKTNQIIHPLTPKLVLPLSGWPYRPFFNSYQYTARVLDTSSVVTPDMATLD